MSHAETFAVAFSHATPTARKRHRCSACSEIIEPGTRYHKYGSVYDGTACTTKQCERCRAIFTVWVECHVEATDGGDPLGEFDDGDACEETNLIYRMVQADGEWGPVLQDRETST